MSIELKCRKTCRWKIAGENPEYPCGINISLGIGAECRDTVEEILKTIESCEDGVVRARKTSGDDRVNFYVTRQDPPMWTDWRTWTRVGQIKDGKFSPRRKRSKSQP